MAAVDDGTDLAVHAGKGLLGTVHAVAAVQILVAHRGQTHHAVLFAHTEHGNHLASDLGGPLDVVGSAGGLGVEHHFLSGTAGQQGADLGQQVFLGHQELFFLGQVQGVAQSALSMGHDGDLGHRHGIVLLLGCHQCVAHLVVGDHLLFLFGQHGALLFGAGDDRLKGHEQIVLIDRLASVAHSTQRGLVDQIGQIGAHAACSGLGDLLQIHVLGQTDVAGMDLQGSQTAGQIGTVHRDAAVETAGTQQGLVQHLGTVGGGQNDDTLGGVETVQFGQQLVQGLLALVVAAETGSVTGFTNGVDLIDEDNTGGHLGGLFEQITDTGCTHAHKHFHKIGTADGEEGHAGLAGHSLGQQGLAGTGGTHQQSALGQLGADFGVLLWVMEHVDDLLQGLLGLVLTGHIAEGDASLLFHIDLGVGLAHATNAAHSAAAHFFEHEAVYQHQCADHQNHGQHITQQQIHQEGRLLHDVRAIGQSLLLLHQGNQAGIGHRCGLIGRFFPFQKIVRDHRSSRIILCRLIRLGVDQRSVFGHGPAILQVESEYAGFHVYQFHRALLHGVAEIGVLDLYDSSSVNAGKQIVKRNGQDQSPYHNGDKSCIPFFVVGVFAVEIFVILVIGSQTSILLWKVIQT